MRKSHLIALLIAIILIAFWGLTRDTGEPVSEEPIKIGGLFGLTGPAAFAGEVSRNGFIMALEDNGLNPDDYVIEDFSTDFSKAVSATTKLTDVDGVDVIIGPEWMEFGEVTIPVAEKAKVPLLSPWANGDEDWMKSKYYFTATPDDRVRTALVLDHMESQGYSKVGIIYNQHNWAVGVANIFKDEVAKYESIEIVLESVVVAGTTDYRTEIAKLKASGADVIYMIIEAGSNTGGFAKQLKELEINKPVYAPAGSSDVLLGDKANVEFAEGFIFPSPKIYERTEEFRKKYNERFGSDPAIFTGATAYDLTSIVLKAIKEGAQSGEEISDYLMNLEGYVGYSAIVSFDDKGVIEYNENELRRINASGTHTLVEQNE